MLRDRRHALKKANDDNKVRAEFLRFLLLGGDDRVAIHENGVRSARPLLLQGALDLRSTVIDTIFNLKHCTLNRVAFFSWAKFSRSLIWRAPESKVSGAAECQWRVIFMRKI